VTLNGNVITAGELNIGGGEVQVSLGDKPWEIAGRYAMVIPDSGFAYTYPVTIKGKPQTSGAQITGSDKIYELSFPAITYHLNDNTKIIAEAIWMLDSLEVAGNDGTYVVAEMPNQVTGATPQTPVTRNGFIPAARMMFQFSF
jgi:hypothetical protein